MEIRLDDRKVYLGDYGKGCDPTRPTVLFVHGAGMDHSVWPLQARHFAYRGWNALAVDLPGHGRSGGELLVVRRNHRIPIGWEAWHAAACAEGSASK
jgi:pimeloyl-ACP methyl ester carboxylesterase